VYENTRMEGSLLGWHTVTLLSCASSPRTLSGERSRDFWIHAFSVVYSDIDRSQAERRYDVQK